MRPLEGTLVVDLTRFRPGVADRLGIGPRDVREHAVYCSITGFGVDGPRAAQAGHDLNYLGYAGVLADTAPALPPVRSPTSGRGLSPPWPRSSRRCSSGSER